MAQTTQASSATPAQVYTVAVLLALFSLLILLLILPPLFWHFRNRNVGATSLVAWIVALLSATFVNAIIWPSDDTSSWFSGVGLCDVEVRIQEAAQVALPASFAAVLRGLAAVLDTDHASVMQTKAQRRRNLLVDLLFCAGAPLLQVVFVELVHFRRYAINGIAGCTSVISDGWLSFVLLHLPPLLWTLVDAVYAALILTRLYRYRLTFATILTAHQTTKSRFLRLYLLCCLWIAAFLPTMLYLTAALAPTLHNPFSWRETHDHAAYTAVFLVPSNGAVYWDRWLWLGTGVCIFLFFGCGREALGCYRRALLAVGVGRCVPALRREPSRRPATASTTNSFGSRARMLFPRKSSASDSWTSTSTASSSAHPSRRAEAPVSPQTTTFLEAVREVADVEKASPPPASAPSFLQRMLSSWAPRKRCSAPVPLAERATVRATVSAGGRPGSLVRGAGAGDVVVRKEVRQGSEYEGV